MKNNFLLLIIATLFVFGFSLVQANTLSKSNFSLTENVLIQYEEQSGSTEDWIGIFEAGTLNTSCKVNESYIAWQYTDGTVGTLDFGNLPVGNYEAQLFSDDSDCHIGRTTVFSVTSSDSDKSDIDKSDTDSTSLSANDNLNQTHFSGEKMEFSQPDGSTIEILLFGGAYFMRAESPNGYTLIFDAKTGWITYAKVSENGERLISSGIPYSNSDLKLKSTFAEKNKLNALNITKKLTYSQSQINEISNKSKRQLSVSKEERNIKSSGLRTYDRVIGTVRQVAILIDFPDRRAKLSKKEVYNSYNASSYGTGIGSVKTWARKISNNLVTLHTDVIGYYTAKNNVSYYKRGGTNNYSAARELTKEALQWADDNFDFSTLTEKYGRVMSVNILYTGRIISNGWANSLWPHADRAYYQTDDGIEVGSYFMNSLGSSAPITSLRTTKHELGHSIFSWPDTYDYQKNSYGSGSFSMERELPCAPFRAMHGWIDVIDINNINQRYHLPDHGNTVLKYTNPSNPNEYFMIEYLRKTELRSKVPDEGLLIWHVDERGNNNYQDMTPKRHYRHSVEQADGLFELERHIKSGSDGDLFHAGYKTSFNDSTIPNSRWWNGKPSGLNISNIGKKGGSSMSVNIGSASGTPKSYTLIIADGGGGGRYPVRTKVTITARAAYSGQVFSRWVVASGKPKIANFSASSTTLTMSAGPAIIYATYRKKISPNTNVASGKTTSQSSTAGSGVSSRAVDGNTSGKWNDRTSTFTSRQSKAWWQVDLGASHQIKKVTVWNRTDCCNNRLSNFHVDALDKNGKVIESQNHTGKAGAKTDFKLSASGVYAVRVQLYGRNYLSLAEVQVFGGAE